jgi:hypothetical protein
MPSADQPLRSDLARTAAPIPGNLKKCKRFPSQEYAASKARRLRRISARAVSELKEAFATGQISLRKFDRLSQRGPKEQRIKIGALNREIYCTQTAAKTIEEMLDDSARSPVQSLEGLADVARRIHHR